MAKATFDALFAGVPRDITWSLQRFWLEHPYTERAVGGVLRRYIAMGSGRRTLLLLPHAFATADSWFLLAEALKKRYRLLVVDGYARQQAFDAERLCDGLVQLLEAEGAYSATVIAHSGGGSIAQRLLQRYPHRVQHLVLCHSIALAPGAPLPLAGGLLHRLPWALTGERLLRAVAPDLPVEGDWAEFARAYLALVAQEVDTTTLRRTMRTERLLRTLYPATTDALLGWPGDVLAITSDDDYWSAGSLLTFRERYPRVQACSLDAGGHWAHLLYPEPVIDRIARFLGERPF
jgi:pimeloyl-ACP methyl ester carboxylesterase